MTYVPGVRQRLTIRVNGASTAGYGFQLSVRLASNEQAQAGRLDPVLAAETQVLCQDGAPRSSGNCNARTPIEFATHVAPKRTNEFQIDWTPPAPAAGNVRIYVAGNAANLNGQNTLDRIFLNNYTLTPASAQPRLSTTNPILQIWSEQPKLSSGTWIYIKGENLAATTRSWAAADFNGAKAPVALDGTQVKVNGKNAFISYVSPTQVNAQPPDDDATGPVEVEVITANGSAKGTITKSKLTPALLTADSFRIGGRQYVVSLYDDGVTYVGRANLIPGVSFRPARPGDRINLYAVGCGPTNPLLPAGTVPSDHVPLASPFRVTFGQTEARATGVMAAPYIGLCQFQVTVPEVSDGDIAIDVAIDGVATGQSLVTTIQR
jgi:uncharacterized protein (TIGR03437 family)